MTLTATRLDKKCGNSGIPDNAKCSKKTTSVSTASTQKPSSRQLTRSNRKLTAGEVKQLSKSQIRWREKNYSGKPSDEEFARRLLTSGTRSRSYAQSLLSAPIPNSGVGSKALKEGIKKGRKNPAAPGSTEAALHELRKRELLNRRAKFITGSALALGATAHVITSARRTY